MSLGCSKTPQRHRLKEQECPCPRTDILPADKSKFFGFTLQPAMQSWHDTSSDWVCPYLFFSARLSPLFFCILVGTIGVYKEVLSWSATQCIVIKECIRFLGDILIYLLSDNLYLTNPNKRKHSFLTMCFCWLKAGTEN